VAEILAGAKSSHGLPSKKMVRDDDRGVPRNYFLPRQYLRDGMPAERQMRFRKDSQVVTIAIEKKDASSYQLRSWLHEYGPDQKPVENSQVSMPPQIVGNASQARLFGGQLVSPLQPNGYCEEELKMLHETRKIMGLPELRLSATCVRVPVLRAHSEAVNIEFEQPFPVAEAQALLAGAPGVELLEDFETNRFPMPTDVTGRDPVAVGRIRQDLSDPNALELWLCGDQIRKGAALNAIQIAELLLQDAPAGGAA